MQPSSLLVGPRLLLSRFTSTISRLVSALYVTLQALLLCFLVLSLGNRKRTRYSPLQRPPMPMDPSQAPDGPLDDFDPTQPGDIWSDYLDIPEVIENGRFHLEHCLTLDPSRYDHP